MIPSECPLWMTIGPNTIDHACPASRGRYTAGMAVRFTVRRLLVLTAAVAFAIAFYLEAVRWRSYDRDETVFTVTPLPRAPVYPQRVPAEPRQAE